MNMIAPAGQTMRNWLDSYYSHVDAMRVDELLEYFAPDAKLSFANFPPAIGRDGIRAALGGVLGAIAGIRHNIKTLWEAPDGTIVFEVDVTYSRRDGREVTVPGCAVSLVRDGQFVTQSIYVDLTPVFA